MYLYIFLTSTRSFLYPGYLNCLFKTPKFHICMQIYHISILGNVKCATNKKTHIKFIAVNLLQPRPLFRHFTYKLPNTPERQSSPSVSLQFSNLFRHCTRGFSHTVIAGRSNSLFKLPTFDQSCNNAFTIMKHLKDTEQGLQMYLFKYTCLRLTTLRNHLTEFKLG